MKKAKNHPMYLCPGEGLFVVLDNKTWENVEGLKARGISGFYNPKTKMMLIGLSGWLERHPKELPMRILDKEEGITYRLKDKCYHWDDQCYYEKVRTLELPMSPIAMGYCTSLAALYVQEGDLKWTDSGYMLEEAKPKYNIYDVFPGEDGHPDYISIAIGIELPIEEAKRMEKEYGFVVELVKN